MSSDTRTGDTEDDASVQDATTHFMQIEDPDEDDVRELVSKAAESTDRSDVDMVTVMAANRTDYDEDVIRGIVDQKRRQGFEVQRIEKFVPYSEDGECEWKFHVSAYGEEAVLVFETRDLRTDSAFRDKMMEVMHQVVPEFDDWETRLDTWLSENNIEERQKSPLSGEHAIAEHVVGAIDRKHATGEMDQFRSFPTSYVYCDPDGGDGSVLVAGELVDECRSQVQGEVSMRKVRGILEPVLSGGSKRIRSEDGRFRVWQFDREALGAQGVELTWDADEEADASLDREDR